MGHLKDSSILKVTAERIFRGLILQQRDVTQTQALCSHQKQFQTKI